MSDICLIYPNERPLGVSNLGFQKMFSRFRSAGMETDVAFFESGKPPRQSERMDLPLDNFKMLAFSLTFEMDYVNLLGTLRSAGVPLRSDERTSDHPLICLGGVAVTMNPMPLADFADIVVIGDGELAVPSIATALVMKRNEAVAYLHGRDGFYIPSLHQDGDKVKRLINLDYSSEGMLQLDELGPSAFMNAGLIETGKGCGQGCRFCATGYIYRPVRHVMAKVLKAQADEALTSHNRVGLVGSAICEHPQVEELFDHIIAKGGEIGVSSLRIGLTPKTMFEKLASAGCKTVTIAPEAATGRLRAVINKPITDDDILQAITDAVSSGIPNVKNYFLVGLPTETDEDVTAIAVLVKRMQTAFIDASRAMGRAGRLSISVNPFIPKPFTPFQWEPMASMKVLKKKITWLRKELSRCPNVDFKSEGLKGAEGQAYLSLAGREAGAALMDALEGVGWKEILKTHQAKELIHMRKVPGAPLPWDVIDPGFDNGYLVKEHKRAMEEKITAACPPQNSGCKRCGEFMGVCC